MTVQFLAFLQDSYREAKSGWMLQIMLVLSILLMLLVASIGFRPVTLADELGDTLSLMNKMMATNPRYAEIGQPKFSIDNMKASNTAEPWKSDYQFDFVVTTPSPEDMKKANTEGMPVSRSEVEAFLRERLSYVNDVHVSGGPPELEKPTTDLEPKAKDKEKDKAGAKGPLLPKEVRYHVTTKGTKAEDRLAWRHQISFLYAFNVPYVYISLREGVFLIEKWLVSGIGIWVLLFVGVVITSGFIPNMLAKGSLDLLVSKPIGRVRLLLYKYIGGLLFVLILTTVTVLGVWFAIGIRSGIWTTNFLATIPITAFYFAVLYAFSTFAAVFTRSTLVAILMTGLAWGGMWCVGKVNDGIESRQAMIDKQQGNATGPAAVLQDRQNDQPLWGFIPRSVFPAVTILHTITPRTFQLDDRLGRLIANGVLTPNQIKKTSYDTPPRVSWTEMILVSLGGIALLLAISCWRFASRDY